MTVRGVMFEEHAGARLMVNGIAARHRCEAARFMDGAGSVQTSIHKLTPDA